MCCLSETDDRMRAFAEKVFGCDTKDEDSREEISLFDVGEDCPILHQELAHHIATDDDVERRWGQPPSNSKTRIFLPQSRPELISQLTALIAEKQLADSV